MLNLALYSIYGTSCLHDVAVFIAKKTLVMRMKDEEGSKDTKYIISFQNKI